MSTFKTYYFWGSLQEESAAVTASIENADGFAQVFPEHKYHIIDVLQKHRHIVGMTGDGVNDAPALKKADCGIAVSGATDAARAAASIVLLTPGLSVIIDAIKESRRIFQRMNSYAIYRIAETLRVLFFMTLAIIVFNFYPVTAVMIVMIALLNDGAILSIAYDNVHYKDKPEAWNMRMVLGISTVLGIIGVIAAFGLFYLAERLFHLDRDQAQTMMYLKLSVAGHLTIFLTRTRGPFWSIRPAKILWMAVLGTQIIATLIAVYGLFMTPLGWGWAGFVWGYALVWFLINDRIKLLAYRIFDRTKSKSKTGTAVLQKTEDKASSASVTSAETKTDTKEGTTAEVKAKPANDAKEEPKQEVKAEAKPADNIEPKPDVKAETKPTDTTGPKPDAKAAAKTEHATESKDEPKQDVKAEAKPAQTTEPKPEVKEDTTTDLNPEIAKRAYEIFEGRSRQNGPALSDWEQAKLEMEIDKLKAASTTETKDAAPKAVASNEPKPEDAAATNSEGKEDAVPKSKEEPANEAPQTVQRVHKLYEELGREDVKEAQDWEKAHQDKQDK